MVTIIFKEVFFNDVELFVPKIKKYKNGSKYLIPKQIKKKIERKKRFEENWKEVAIYYVNTSIEEYVNNIKWL